MKVLATYKKIGRIGYITLKREALNLDLVNQLIEIFKLSIKKQDICVILKTSENNFSLGQDLKYTYDLITNSLNKSQAFEEIYRLQELTILMREHPGIIIVGYQGWVIGGGFEFTLFCDLRIAADNTKIWLPELDVGMFFSNASSKVLSWLIGASRTKEMMILGKKIPAQIALEYGIVNEICQLGDLNKVLRKIAAKIVKKSPIALNHAKKIINQSTEITFDDLLYKETRLLIELGNSEEAKMRIASFLNHSKKRS